MLVIDVTREDKTIDEQFREMDIIVNMDEHCNLPITNWKGIEPSVCPLCMSIMMMVSIVENVRMK